MKISVVIPAYNEEEYLASCLWCLSHQTRSPDEVIVIDNNSADATAQIAKRYGARVILETTQGMIPARNRGFDEAEGSIIVRTDADSRPPHDWIAHIEAHFTSGVCEALSGPLRYYDLPGKPGIVMCNMTMLLLKKWKSTVLMLGPNFALERALWQSVRDTVCNDDRMVHEDVDLALRIANIGGRIHWDKTLIMPTSARRIRKRPLSFFGEYPIRFAKTCVINSALSARTKNAARKAKASTPTRPDF